MNICNLDKDEVLRYLGYNGQLIDEKLNILIDNCIEEVLEKSNIKYLYRSFSIKREDNKINLIDTSMELKGKDINKLLKDSNKCVIMIVTLGNDIEKLIRVTSKVNLTKSIILDACATTLVEEVCDRVEDLIKDDISMTNENITMRYSPGYGDLPLDIQGDIISIMDARRRIGLTVSAHNLLMPRKSVTAIIGIGDNKQIDNKKSCSNCNKFESCVFRRKGNSCGY